MPDSPEDVNRNVNKAKMRKVNKTTEFAVGDRVRRTDFGNAPPFGNAVPLGASGTVILIRCGCDAPTLVEYYVRWDCMPNNTAFYRDVRCIERLTPSGGQTPETPEPATAPNYDA